MSRPATDTATHSGERVTIKIRLGVPAKSSRNPRRPSDGEQRLLQFVQQLRQENLVEASELGALTDDGTRFSFTLCQYPLKPRLDKVCAAYHAGTGRQLRFETQSDGDDAAEIASEGIDWADLLTRALDAIRRLNPLD